MDDLILLASNLRGEELRIAAIWPVSLHRPVSPKNCARSLQDYEIDAGAARTRIRRADQASRRMPRSARPSRR